MKVSFVFLQQHISYCIVHCLDICLTVYSLVSQLLAVSVKSPVSQLLAVSVKSSHVSVVSSECQVLSCLNC